MNELESLRRKLEPTATLLQPTITNATAVGQKFEKLVSTHTPVHIKADVQRARQVIGYWSLVFDYHKSILCLVDNGFYGGACALLRPMLEATLRAHVAMSCKQHVLESLKSDRYKLPYKEIGPQLDKQFGTDGFFERLMNRASNLLHSFTHSGEAQLSRRFIGPDVGLDFTPQELVEVITHSTAFAFMVTLVTTKYLGFDEEWAEANNIYRKEAIHLFPGQ